MQVDYVGLGQSKKARKAADVQMSGGGGREMVTLSAGGLEVSVPKDAQPVTPPELVAAGSSSAPAASIQQATALLAATPKVKGGGKGGKQGGGKRSKGKGGGGGQASSTREVDLMDSLARLALQSAQQLRAVRSSVVRVSLLPKEHPCLQATSSIMDQYSALVPEFSTPEEKFAQLGHPASHSWNAVIAWAAEEAARSMQDVAPRLEAYLRYIAGRTGTPSALDGYEDEITSFRVLKSWSSTHKKVETVIVQGTRTWEIAATVEALWERTGGRRLRGVAAPGQLERNVQTGLDSRREWWS